MGVFNKMAANLFKTFFKECTQTEITIHFLTELYFDLMETSVNLINNFQNLIKNFAQKFLSTSHT